MEISAWKGNNSKNKLHFLGSRALAQCPLLVQGMWPQLSPLGQWLSAVAAL